MPKRASDVGWEEAERIYTAIKEGLLKAPTLPPASAHRVKSRHIKPLGYTVRTGMRDPWVTGSTLMGFFEDEDYRGAVDFLRGMTTYGPAGTKCSDTTVGYEYDPTKATFHKITR